MVGFQITFSFLLAFCNFSNVKCSAFETRWADSADQPGFIHLKMTAGATLAGSSPAFELNIRQVIPSYWMNRDEELWGSRIH